MNVRRADFAGSWYPGDRSECRRMIEAFMKEARPCPNGERKHAGGIVPHAGWVFSGLTACNVIQCLQASRPQTVVLFGRHLHPGSPNFIMTQGAWETPLGNLSIDEELAGALVAEFPFEVETATRYGQDNTIELQLPFIRHFFPEAGIVPIGVPPAAESIRIGRRVVELAASLKRDILVIGSTDLTHYGMNYGFTPQGVGEKALDWVRSENDRRVIDRMLTMDAEGVIEEGLRNQNACCAGAAAAAIAASRALGVEAGQELVYATSYDVRPDTSFVGYVGIVF
jgi:MEMO1 family protein